MPAIGAVVSSAWRRAVVHRVDGDQVVLRDLDTPTAFVTCTLAELGRRYEATGEVLAAPRPPAPPRTNDAPVAPARKLCGGCGLPAIATVTVETPAGDAEFCWRCYGVSEEQREATGALSTGWTPPPGEAYESREEVGSFDRPPPEERIARPRPPRPRPRRVKPDEWQALTGERPR